MQTENFIQGKRINGSNIQTQTSPIDGREISSIHSLETEKLQEVFRQMKILPRANAMGDMAELKKLAEYITEHKEAFTQQIILDAGFNHKDALDLVDGTIHFCSFYENHIEELPLNDTTTSFSFSSAESNSLIMTSTPYGFIAATTPRNTPLITELTILVHALWSGNAVIIRPSPGVAGTVTLLIKALEATFLPETLKRLSIVFTDAKDFVSTSFEYADLLHYVGSTKYLASTLIAGIEKGVKVLLDGDGCSTVVVDKSADIKQAAQACYEGLVRCNGEICITIRVILVEASVKDAFMDAFLPLISQTRVTNELGQSTDGVGPLFSEAQVSLIHEAASRYEVLSGSVEQSALGANYTSPIVVILKEQDKKFYQEKIFGPMAGIATYSGDEWKSWLRENAINLTDAVFSTDPTFIESFLETSTSPRKVINTDPTVESVFEPWGAFLPSGWNDVSYWYTKYRKPFQKVQRKQ